VVCGYNQISGVDFNESFAPVINDVSLRIILITKLIWVLEPSIFYVEHGELQEEIFMNIPEGMSDDSKHCLLLTKTLVQSAREFYKKVMSTLKLIVLKGSESDPCLLSKRNEYGVIMIGIYVDDCLVIGKCVGIDELLVELKTSGFKLKIENNFTDYLICKLTENAELKEIVILQPHLINNLEAKFGDEVKNKRILQNSRNTKI
jgi:hypothetical protein